MAASKQVDVLIVGAGPSGLTAALLLARAGINSIVIIDKGPIPVQTGHAAGLQPRTEEILHTLGIYLDLANGAGQVVETAFWGPGGPDGGIKRTSVAPEVTNETPYPKLTVQHQGQTEKILNRELGKRGHSVLRPYELKLYEYSKGSDYPIRAIVHNGIKGDFEVWECKYILGADGAKSSTRTAAGIDVQINQSEDTWLVVDAHADTDFPDFRRRAAIQTEHGNLMIIPNPQNGIRIYMLIQEEDFEELTASKAAAPEQSDVIFFDAPKTKITSLLDIYRKRLPKIMHPYRMDIKDCEWISQYKVGQTITESFWDGRSAILLGDSCHSHSPKAAQGMNTGIQDAHNLAWKLALILKGFAGPKLLEIYDQERKHISKQLIDFDQTFASLFGTQEKINSPEFHDTWKNSQGFTSGCGHHYPANMLVQGQETPSFIAADAADPLTPGKRFCPINLIRHIDGWQVNSLDDMPANGNFYEIIFPGNISSEPRRSEFNKVYSFITSPNSAITKYNGTPPSSNVTGPCWDFEDIYTPSEGNKGKIIDVFIIHTADHLSVELRPEFELWKYRFYEDKEAREYRKLGLDPNKITVAIVRPDGVVGLLCTSDDMGKKVPEYFKGIMEKSR